MMFNFLIDEKRKPDARSGFLNNGRGGWIRTNAWRDQNPLPYRLATPLQGSLKLIELMAGAAGFEPTHGGIKTRCLTAWLRPCRNYSYLFRMVRKKRLELLRLAALEPKSSASTNFATSACMRKVKWWLQRESNLRPQHYECCALTS